MPETADELEGFPSNPSPGAKEPGKGGGPSVGEPSVRSMQKVELDLDDAPFLAEEEPKPEPAKQEDTESAPAGEASGPSVPLWKRKKVIIALAAVLALALVGGGAAFFLMRPKAEVANVPPPPPLPPLSTVEEKAPDQPPVLIKMEPFLVELTDKSGSVHFLSFRFSISSSNLKLTAEMNAKLLVLRDAVYYYLRNKSFEYLADTRNLGTLKFDVVTVMNQYLGEDQLENLQIEEYLVR